MKLQINVYFFFSQHKTCKNNKGHRLNFDLGCQEVIN